MKVINKQKFLAELGRLLTFMYEEDRLEVLSLYEELFDSVSDEQALLQLLVSPTRQAVVLARSYQSGNGKLQVHSSSRIDEASEDETPSHINAVYELKHEAELAGLLAPVVDDNQLSFFDDGTENVSESVETPADAPIPESAETAAVEEAAVPDISAAPDLPDAATPAAKADGIPASSEAESAPEAAPVSETDAAPVENSTEVSDAVDSFLSGFSIEGAELSAEPAFTFTPVDMPVLDPIEDDFSAPLDEGKPVRRLSPLLLILYLIPAVPVGIAVTALLLVPAVVFLTFGVSVLGFGGLLLVSAFGSFAMLSDILVVFGGALIVLAFGLLFVWVFVWFIGVAIVGFIRALCRLGRKWCSKEVSA